MSGRPDRRGSRAARALSAGAPGMSIDVGVVSAGWQVGDATTGYALTCTPTGDNKVVSVQIV